MNWSIASGTLPPGIVVDPSTGALSGTPTTAGVYPFTAIDSAGTQGDVSYMITIASAVTGTSPIVLPSGVVGQPYTGSLVQATTPPPPTGNLTEVFPTDHILNTPIDTAPLASNSAAMIAQMVSDNAAAGQASVSVHPGFEIPINEGVFPMTPITFASASESDNGPYPIPANPLTEGGGDDHCIVRETDTNKLYEVYQFVQGPPVSGGSGATWDLTKYDLRTLWSTSADAGGLPIYPLLIRASEFKAGVINHALRVTVKNTRNFGYYAGMVSIYPSPAGMWPATWPARHRAGSSTNPNDPAMGERFRLKASFDDSAFSPETKIITACLKKYGCIVADQGGSVLFGLQGDTDPSWLAPTSPSPAGVAYDNLTVKLVTELRNVNLTDFEVVDGVTGFIISADSGQAKQPA